MSDEDKNEGDTEENNLCLDGNINMRANQTELDIFIAKSKRATGTPYQVLIREMITAFNDGRLRIIPTEAQKASLTYLGELYNVDRK